VSNLEGGNKSASVDGLRDTLREGLKSGVSTHNGRHPLERRLQNWEDTQMEFKMESYRRLYGAGEPIRRAMEMEIVSKGSVLPDSVTQSTNVHLDILKNKDTGLDWEDVYPDRSNEGTFSFHAEMERRINI
jgi:proteasome maturation protein